MFTCWVSNAVNSCLYNPWTPRVKLWVIQSSLTFDSMCRTLKCYHSLESCWAVLYYGAVNHFTPRVKPLAIQSFLSFGSMDRTLNCEHSLESCWAVLYCGAVCFSILLSLWFWKIYQFWTNWHCKKLRVNILHLRSRSDSTHAVLRCIGRQFSIFFFQLCLDVSTRI